MRLIFKLFKSELMASFYSTSLWLNFEKLISHLKSLKRISIFLEHVGPQCRSHTLMWPDTQERSLGGPSDATRRHSQHCVVLFRLSASHGTLGVAGDNFDPIYPRYLSVLSKRSVFLMTHGISLDKLPPPSSFLLFTWHGVNLVFYSKSQENC